MSPRRPAGAGFASIPLPPAILPALLLGALAACEAPPPAVDTQPPPAEEAAPISSAEVALEGAHIPTVDPARMVEAELEKALGEGPLCLFRYTNESRPVLGLRVPPNSVEGEGVVKLNGHLVPLAVELEPGAILLAAEGLRFVLTPVPGTQEEEAGLTDLVFEAGDRLSAGYRGYYRCGA